MTGLTGVMPDSRQRIGGGRWVAVWRLETTRGTQFLHRPVDGYGLTRDEAMFEAASNPPEEVARLRKSPFTELAARGEEW